MRLPKNGRGREELLKEMRALRGSDYRWDQGRTWSLVYHAGDEHTEFLKKAYGLYFSENALNPGAFPSLRKFEAEVVSMVCDLFHGGASAAGTMTSGGTESILMAVKTYRDRARALRPGIEAPEMILPVSAHPAFEKAAHYFDVKPVHVPLGPDFRVDVAAVRKAVTPDTILIVGSAPAYPQGVMDPIEELATLAREADLGMHVDACVGGYLLPFLVKLGHPIPPFDFAVPGVTSISADLHKYGFAAKGASTILYRDADLRRYQFFVYADWPGGIFGSPSLCGTRPGGSIAAAWATLNAFGEDGYLKMAEGIMKTTRELQDGIAAIPGLYVHGKPHMSVFSFGSDAFDIFAAADAMQARGWHIDRQQNPSSIHLMVTPAHAGIAPRFLADLRECAEHARANPAASQQGTAATYGLLAKIPDRSKVKDFILQYMDDLYKTGA